MSVEITDAEITDVGSDSVSVSATIERLEDDGASVTEITLESNDDTAVSTFTELDVGGSASVARTLDYEPSHTANEVTITVGADIRSEYDSVVLPFDGDVPAEPSITSVDAENIEEGETSTIDVTVMNVGDREGTISLTGQTDDDDDSTSLTLLDGESATTTLYVRSGATGGSDTATVTATSPDGVVSDTASVAFAVEPYTPDIDIADFEITSLTVEEGIVHTDNTFTVSVRARDNGSYGDDAPFRLRVGYDHDSSGETVVFNPHNRIVERTFDLDVADVGRYELTAELQDEAENRTADFADTQVQIRDTAEALVTDIDAPDSFVEGNSVTLDATIRNVGDVTDSFNAVATHLGSDRFTREEDIELDPNEEETVSLRLRPDADAPDTIDIEVSGLPAVASLSDSEVTDDVLVSIEVEELIDPSDLLITSLSAPSRVDLGAPFDVDVTVEQDGDTPISDDVTLNIAGVTESIGVSTSDDGDTDSFSKSISVDNAGIYTLSAETDDDSASTSVTVGDDAQFNVEIRDVTSSAVEGDDIDVLARVKNKGDLNGSTNITLQAGETPVDDTSVSLDGGERKTEELTWSTDVGDRGEHKLRVSVDGDTDTTVREVTQSSPDLEAVIRTTVSGQTIDIPLVDPDSPDLDYDGLRVTVDEQEFAVDLVDQYASHAGPFRIQTPVGTLAAREMSP